MGLNPAKPKPRSPSSVPVSELRGGHRPLGELSPDLDPWERQPKESPGNYAYFRVYCDMGRTRSVRKACAQAGRAEHYFRLLMSCNLWVRRAEAWDLEQDRIFSLQVADHRRKLVETHVSAARELMAKALNRLADIDPDSISPHALVLMFDTAAKIERAALGMEDQRAAAQVSVTTSKDAAGEPTTRVEVAVLRDQIMDSMAAMVTRMSPDQIAAGYAELEGAAGTLSGELSGLELDTGPSPTSPTPG